MTKIPKRQAPMRVPEQKPPNARWKRPRIEKSWELGRVVIDEGGPDLVLAAAYGGGLHTIAREYVQVLRRGPRGGQKWEQLKKIYVPHDEEN